MKSLLELCSIKSSKLTPEEINTERVMMQMSQLKWEMYQRLSSNNGSGPEFLFQKENEHTVPLIYKLIQNKEK